MQLETILMVSEQRHSYHLLRAELMGSCYRLVRARNSRIAHWLISRRKIGLLVICDPQTFASDAPTALANNRMADSDAWQGPCANSLLISRDDSLGVRCGSILGESEKDTAQDMTPNISDVVLDTDFDADAEQEVLRMAEEQRIPVLRIMPGWPDWPAKSLISGVNRGADYILLAPYDQSQLIQAIRTAMLNGASQAQDPQSTPLEIALQDRICTLNTSRERMAKMLIGTLEQLQHVKAALSWSESEIHELRQTVIRNEMKSQSTSKLPEAIEGIAHDFSNLLEAAGPSNTSLHWSAQNPQHYREALRGVMEQAQALLDCLLQMARPTDEPWRTEPVDLRSIVDQALSAALLPLREPLIRVRVRVGGLDPVWVHRSVIFRALVNLIWNAVQAMPHGGMLSLVGYVRGNRVVLEVSDTGTGIAMGDQQKVFNEPFSTKPGHRGLGLSLVRDLLAKCGGEITYTSRPDRGSSFCLALPIARTTELARPALVPARRKVSELVAVGKFEETSSAKNAAESGAMLPAKNHRPVVLQS